MTLKLASVTELYDSNARQIPAMLRKLAGDIESPPVEDAAVDQVLCVIRDSRTGRVNVYGWGTIDLNDSIAMATIAQRQLSVLADAGVLWVLK